MDIQASDPSIKSEIVVDIGKISQAQPRGAEKFINHTRMYMYMYIYTHIYIHVLIYIYGGFLSHGGTKNDKWMVIRDNPTLKWMMTGGTPMSGTPHIYTYT